MTHDTAADFRNRLEAELQARSSRTGEQIHRLRRKVAFDRLLARICTQDPSPFFLKGGYGMELRISQARATKDLDLTCSMRIRDAHEPLSELILQELQSFARLNLSDYFAYQIGQSQIDIENAPYGGSRHGVTALIDNRLFAQFHIDVGGDFLIDPVEEVGGTDWLQFCGIAAPIIPMISIEQQFAEKLHSYTLPRERINTRTKDLIDLILLLKQEGRALKAFQRSVQRVFGARNTHVLPAVLPEPPVSWQKPFATLAAECGISQSLEEGFWKVSEFYNLLRADLKGTDCAQSCWISH
ncbi:MAG: nucleotidyl transferase AbiEii/AbiGii toxin family protein [Chlamydiia bacterium]